MRPETDPRTRRWIAVRIVVVAAFLGIGLVAVAARAVQLGVVQRDRLASEARDQYVRQVVQKPRRGVITDRSGVLLAGSADAESVYADPALVGRGGDPRRAAKRLAAALKLDARALEKRLANPESRFAWVKRRASPAEVAAVKALAIPGIAVVPETRRYYPKTTLAAHLLGFVGDDGEGLEGVEHAFDEVLRGEHARVASLRDGAGQMALHEAPTPGRAREGARVELTIDTGLQLAAERALGAAVEGSRALSGMAVALDPRTGEVLAMASAPAFNPNAPKRGETMRNRVVTDTYEPGSTLKTFVIAGALDRGVLTPLDAIDCEDGRYRIGAHVIRDTHALGWAGPSKILALSSNIGAAKIGARLGRTGVHEVLRAFGFGERSGIGLPGEHRGTLAVPRSDAALATSSFGHGLTATALQVTSAMGAIANGGVLVRPAIVRRVVDPATQDVLEAAQPLAVRQAVSRETAATLTRWLVGAVEDGTGKRARLDGWRIAGKTGTAQKVDPVSGGYVNDRHFASFVGFAPAEDPRVVVGVFLDEPKGEIHGGEVAAPAFREIVEYALKMFGVPPRETAVAAAEPEPSAAPPSPLPSPPANAGGEGEILSNDRVAVPSLAGLPARAAIRELERRELVPDLAGQGRVNAQTPPAGRVVTRGTRVRITLTPPG
ncbi:MAG TPA: penicillin-binding transpeptidase domain-containing protein [Anaeromyxobacteraceae bacterium]|nr:penicillin-binding transpeptidase domain-containing protein [Anaeromyxobacteraceae bacterium]